MNYEFYDRTDLFKRIDVNKTSESNQKLYDICHY